MTWPIIGNQWAVELLSKALAARRLAHAYLFSGPPQIGKTRLAITLAQALNCKQPDAPCGVCPSCIKTEKGSHPDVHLVEEMEPGTAVKIEQIRALQREAVLAPYEGAFRVLILRRFDRATPEAANSLLKTLEEPPPKVILVLTAVEPELLPTTVLSRCQRIDLRPAPLSVIEAALVDRGLGADRARLLAHLSGGRVGWALAASQGDEDLHLRQEGLEKLLALLSADRVARFDFAQQASRDVPLALDRIELWAVLWRDLLHLCSQADDHVVNVDHLDQLRALARRTTVTEALGVVKALKATLEHLEANVNPRLAMEGLMLKLPWGMTAA